MTRVDAMTTAHMHPCLLLTLALSLLLSSCGRGEPADEAENSGGDEVAASDPEPPGDGTSTSGSNAEEASEEDPEGLADPELRLILGLEPVGRPELSDLLRRSDLELVFGLADPVEEAALPGSGELRYQAMRLRPEGSDAFGVSVELFMMRNTRDARLRFDELRNGSLGSIQRVDVGTEGFVDEGPGLLRIHVLDYATRTIFMVACSVDEGCNAAQLMRQSSIILDRLRIDTAD